MRFTLGKKLGLSFGVILSLMAVSTVLSFVQLGNLKDDQDRVMAVRVPTIAALKDARDLATRLGAGSSPFQPAYRALASDAARVGHNITPCSFINLSVASLTP